MILSMTVAAPKAELDRSKFDRDTLARFERTTGIIRSRRWEGSTTSLAVKAAKTHQKYYPEHFDDLDAIIVVTQSPDRNSPAMAAELHLELGLQPGVMVFDVNQSCDGFVYGLSLAASIGRVLVVCVDKLRAKPGTTEELLFSDGAVAAIVEPGGFRPERFYTDGSGAQFLSGDKDGLLCMHGGQVFDFVTSRIPKFINEYLGKYGPFDFLAQHQPNLSMMALVDKKTGFKDRSLHAIADYGNMSMCSVAAALAANEEKVLGKSVLLCGYGAGWCAAAIGIESWPTQRICGIEEV